MGYWLMIAIVVCALVAVVVAFVNEPDETESSKPTPRAKTKRMVCFALGGVNDTGLDSTQWSLSNWTSKLATSLPADVLLHSLPIEPGSTELALCDQLPVVLAMRPRVVALWLTMSDLAGDTPLERCQRALHSMLDQLNDAGIRVVLGNAYFMCDDSAVIERTRAWNAIIAREAATFGARLVDLEPDSAELASRMRPIAPMPWLYAAGQQMIANRFYPAMMAAIEAVRSADARG